MRGPRLLAAVFAIAPLSTTSCAKATPLPQITSAPSPREFYVSLPAENAVLRIDMDAGRIVGRTVVGSLPHNFALDREKKHAYVTLSGSQAVAELDVVTGALLRTMLTEPVPSVRPDGRVIREHEERHASTSTTCFSCHHGGEGGAHPTIVGSRPYGIQLSADGRRIYVTTIKGGLLSLIDRETGKATVVPVPPTGDAREPTAITRLGSDIYISVLPTLPSLSFAVIRRLAADGATVLGEVATGSNAGLLFADEARGRIYASNFESNTISRFDRELHLIDKVTVSDGPLGQTLLGDGRHMLVADYYGNAVSEVDLELGAVRGPRPGDDTSLLVNPTHFALSGSATTAYVLSSGPSGSLGELDLDRLAVKKSVAVGTLPFDVLRIPTIAGPVQ